MSTNFTLLARDRYRLTSQALISLEHAGMSNMTLTVLDDRSEHSTCELLKRYGALRNLAPIGTGQARNLVIAASQIYHGRGNWLYISDNDVWFSMHWLERLIEVYERIYPEYFVLGAVNHPFHQPVSFILFENGTRVNEVNALATQSMLMRWEVWDRFGPFCQTPIDKVCQSEDVDFTNKIRAAGGKLGVVSPALVVNCGITNTFGEHIPGWEMVKRQAPHGVVVE